MKQPRLASGSDEGGPGTPPSIRPYLGLSAVVALWVDLGPIHRHHQGDSLLNVLVSLQAWTPFLWEQDRYGMLIPLLVRPIHDPFANMLIQEFLSIGAGLSAFFLLARYVLRDGSYPLAAGLGASAFLALAPLAYAFEVGIDTGFGLGMALGLGALILAGPTTTGAIPGVGRLIIALGLMVLAHWVNLGTIVFLGPLALFRAVVLGERWSLETSRWPSHEGRWRDYPIDRPIRLLFRGLSSSELARSLILLGLGYRAGTAIMTLSPYRQTSMSRLPPARWPHAWSELSANTWESLSPHQWPTALLLAAGVGLVGSLAFAGARPHLGRSLRASAVLIASAVVVMGFTGIWSWVEWNAYSFRYFIPAVILIQAAPASLAVAGACGMLDPIDLRRARFAIGPLMLASAAWGHGFPSPSRVRADLDRTCGGLTADILEARCTHVAGDYWSAWPAVFHANLVRSERGDPGMVWGLTFRAHPSSRRWRAMPRDRLRIAVPEGDPMAERWIASYGLSPTIEAGRRPTIVVRRPAERSREP